MLTKMVKDGEGCYVGVELLGIVKVTNSRVIYYRLNEDIDSALSGLVGLLVLE
jgi:hypothetical protein